jgi:hypothetical protein
MHFEGDRKSQLRGTHQTARTKVKNEPGRTRGNLGEQVARGNCTDESEKQPYKHTAAAAGFVFPQTVFGPADTAILGRLPAKQSATTKPPACLPASS